MEIALQHIDAYQRKIGHQYEQKYGLLVLFSERGPNDREIFDSQLKYVRRCQECTLLLL